MKHRQRQVVDDHCENINSFKVADLYHSGDINSVETNYSVKMRNFVLIGFVESLRGTVNCRILNFCRNAFLLFRARNSSRPV